jgi:hypothetical protein
MQTAGNMKKIQMPKINAFLLFPPIEEAMSLLGFPENSSMKSTARLIPIT